nr:hypothetical protein [Escherichia coli]
MSPTIAGCALRSCPTGYQTGSSLYRHCAWTMSMRIWLGGTNG